MIIEHVYIQSFGRLNNLNATLGSGVNIVNGKNEAGKSTFCNFIKFILYGAIGPKNEPYKYLSWDTGRAAGYLDLIMDDERKIRIEREAFFTSAKDGRQVLVNRCQSYDLESNRPILQNKIPGEELLGVTLDIFENTIFIRQIDDNKVEGKALASSAENIIFSADEEINIDSALEQLEIVRTSLVNKKGTSGKLQELSTKRDELEHSLFEQEANSADIIRLKNKIAKDEFGIDKSNAVFAQVDLKRTNVINYNLKKDMAKRQQLYYEVKAVEEQRDNLKKCTNHANGKIYEQAFIDDLKTSIGEIEKVNAARSSAEKIKEETNEKFYTIKDKAAKLEQVGGNKENIEKIKKKVESIHAKVSNSQLSYFIFLIIGLIFVALGAVVTILQLFDPIIIAYIILITGAVLIIVSFVLLIRYLKFKKQQDAFLKEKGMANYQEYMSVISFALNDNEYIMLIKSEKEKAENDFKKINDQYNSIVSKAVEYLQEYRFTTTNEIDIILDLQNAIKECELLKTKIEALDERIDDKHKTMDVIDDHLKQYSDDYLKNVIKQDFDDEEYSKYNIDEINKQYTAYSQQIERQKAALNQTKIELAKLEAVYPDPATTAENFYTAKEQCDELRERYLSIELAMEALDIARNKMKDGLSPKIAESASNYISVLSNGKYTKIGLTNDFDVTYDDVDGTPREISQLSAGTADIAYLAMRFALIENLYKLNKPPFIFDESFSRLDPIRLKNVLTLLADLTNNGLQCLIFTCHGREEAILKQYTKYLVHNIQ